MSITRALSESIRVRLSTEMKGDLDDAAKREDRPRGYIIRRALRRELERVAQERGQS